MSEYYLKNKDRMDARGAIWRKNNPERLKEIQRNAQLKHTYGITAKQYDRLFEEQEGCCAMCGTHQTELTRRLDVDHCHSTNEIRGLLCRNCNMVLGKYEKYKEVCEAYLVAIIREDA